MLIGSIFKYYLPNAAYIVSKVLGKGAFPALMLLAIVFFLQYKTEITANFMVLGTSATLLILLAILCSSLLSRMGHFDNTIQRTIVIEVGMQNAGLATNLAGKHFASEPNAALAAAVSCVWHSISGTFLAAFFRLLDKIKDGSR